MIINNTQIVDSFLVNLNDKFHDDRGKFSRLFCIKELSSILQNRVIKQINFSETYKIGTIRGLHYQLYPYEEMKFIKCIYGKIFDVVIDMRKDSKSYLKWQSFELSGGDSNLLIIPEGCAHGFQVMEENSKLLYLHTEVYMSSHETGIRYSSEDIGIAWPLDVTNISQRDAALKTML